jgi:hypothetical protein
MGLDLLVFNDIVDLVGKGATKKHGKIVELGAQQISANLLFHPDAFAKSAAMHGVTSPLPAALLVDPSQSPLSNHLAADAPPARLLWEWLGYEYRSIDIDGSPGAIDLDLNFDSIPADMCNQFDLVTNFGTTEHVVNQLNAFKIMHDLACVGGLMVHALPSQGYLNHGLINYNPKFFWMLARSNGYKWHGFRYHYEDPTQYPFPNNIIEALSEPDASQLAGRVVTDTSMYILLEKRYDMSFIPPIDITDCAQAPSAALHKRYWTVFEKDAFDRFDSLMPIYEPARVLPLLPQVKRRVLDLPIVQKIYHDVPFLKTTYRTLRNRIAHALGNHPKG